MGDRYILEMTCPKCGTEDDDVYFAPTCGFTEWKCPSCHFKMDLCEHTGISYEDASNRDELESLLKEE